ncbi:MAG: hypothetical protein QM784_38930, partial [Polyangiaceae bacterium]
IAKVKYRGNTIESEQHLSLIAAATRSETTGALKVILSKGGRGVEASALAVTVGGAVINIVKGDRNVSGGAMLADTVAGAQIVKAKNVTFTAQASLSIVMGGSVITMTPASVTFAGVSIKVDSGAIDLGADDHEQLGGTMMQFEATLTTSLFVTSDVSMFTITQTLGIPQTAVVEFVTTKGATLDEIVGSPAQLAYSYNGGTETFFAGIIESIELVSHGSHQKGFECNIGFRARIVSRLGSARRERQ